jgi:hypothetical protein
VRNDGSIGTEKAQSKQMLAVGDSDTAAACRPYSPAAKPKCDKTDS